MTSLTIRTNRGTFTKLFPSHKEASAYYRAYCKTHRVLGYSMRPTEKGAS